MGTTTDGRSRFLDRLCRFSLPGLFAATAATNTASQMRDRSWLWYAAFIVTYLVEVSFIMLALHRYAARPHGRYTVPCRSEHEIRTSRRLRAFAALGHPGVVIGATAVLSGAVLVTALQSTSEPAQREHTEFDWVLLAVWMTLMGAVVLFVSARNFRRRNAWAFPTTDLRARIETLAGSFGHRNSYWVGVVSIAAFVTLIVTTPDKGVWSAARVAAVLLVMTMDLFMAKHGRSLCTACASEFRVDTPAYTETRAWMFRLMHRLGTPVYLTSVLCILVAAFSYGTIFNACMALSLVLSAAITPLRQFHARYQPWCPICRNGGKEAHDTGVPDPHSDVPLPV